MPPAGDRGTRGPSGGELLGLGVLLAAALVVPLVAGIAVDAASHRAPVFSFVGLFMGIAAAVGTAYKRFSKYL